MSESAVILEGEVARRFNPVDKLRATNQDSSVSDWVPSDTLDLGSLMASENNLYLANIDDDCDAYEEVEVDVSTDLEDADDETKNTHKITGTGSDGNDYAVGLDENGNLTTEMVPAAIHIVVPPRKLKYEEGETIDFDGIHVYLMDGNNHRYTDSQYPTGEIPFGELMFPVTIASGEEPETASSDLVPESFSIGGFYAFNKWSVGDGAYRYTEYKSAHPCMIAYKNNINVRSVVFASMWQNATVNVEFIYMYVNKDGEKTEIQNETTTFQLTNEYTHNNKTAYYNVFPSNGEYKKISPTPTNIVSNENYGAYAWTMLYGDVSSNNNNIPVQWMRSDGEILEDTFKIEVGEGGEPEPPQPDPWGGYADVSWGGHHYNINRRIVPEVHYANGYCWQEGTSEYSVEQSASMGWLILIR